MQLTQQALQEFKELWRHDHQGKDISDDELFDIANRILSAVDLIYFSNPHEKK